jgi:hypothetical protein
MFFFGVREQNALATKQMVTVWFSAKVVVCVRLRKHSTTSVAAENAAVGACHLVAAGSFFLQEGFAATFPGAMSEHCI